MYVTRGKFFGGGDLSMHLWRTGMAGWRGRQRIVRRPFLSLPVAAGLAAVLMLLLPGAVPARAADDGERIIRMSELLRQKEARLDERERLQDEREARLNMLKQEIENKERRLEDLRRQVDEAMAAYQALKDEDLSRLIEVYSAMKPAAAAPLVEKLELKYGVEVVLRMQPRKAAKLLSAIDGARAREISRAVTELQGLEEGQ